MIEHIWKSGKFSLLEPMKWLVVFISRNGKREKHEPLFRTERRFHNEPTEHLLICESDGALLIYDRRQEQKRIAPILSRMYHIVFNSFLTNHKHLQQEKICRNKNAVGKKNLKILIKISSISVTDCQKNFYGGKYWFRLETSRAKNKEKKRLWIKTSKNILFLMLEILETSWKYHEKIYSESLLGISKYL